MFNSLITSESFQESLEILAAQSESVDLLLSDVIMPGLNGYHLGMEVKKLYPKIKIQIVSGFTEMQGEYNVDEINSVRNLFLYSPSLN